MVEAKRADGAKMLDKLDEEIKATPAAETKLHPDVKAMLVARRKERKAAFVRQEAPPPATDKARFFGLLNRAARSSVKPDARTSASPNAAD